MELGLASNNAAILKKAFELALAPLAALPRARKEKLVELCPEEEAPTQILPGGEFTLHRKNFQGLAELLGWAADLLESGPAGEEKASLVLGDVLGYFNREEIERLLMG